MSTSKETSEILGLIQDRRRLFSKASASVLGGSAFVSSQLWITPKAQAATNAYYDMGGVVFNVKAYGASGSGSDDTAAIKATINAAQAAGGGVVYFPQGIYIISSSVSITSNGITLAGAGQAATTIKISASFPTGDAILFSNIYGGSLRSLRITSDAPRQGGAAIHLNNASGVSIQEIDMINMFIGCLIDGAGGILQNIERGYWSSFATDGCGIWINTGNDQFISDLVIDSSANIGNQPLAGIRITNSQAVWVRSCDIIHAKNGLLIDPISGGTVCWCFFSDCAWDTCGSRGIFINPASGATVKGLNFVNCWSSTSQTFDGCYIGGPVDGVEFVGHRFFNNKGNGLVVYGPAKNVFADACGASGNMGNGFAFTGNCNSFAVRNSRTGSYAGFGTSQTYGIVVTAGCSNYIISGNLTQGNVTAGIGDNGGPTKVVANNI